MRIGRELRRVQSRIRSDLRLPEVPTLQDLVDAVATIRGKEIAISYESLPPGYTGLCVCVQGLRTDVILIDKYVDDLLKLHIACHELAHLWFDHHPSEDGLLDPASTRGLPQTDDPVTRVVYMKRSHNDDHYGQLQEQEAELAATELADMLMLDPAGPAAATRITSSLAHWRSGV